MIYQKDKSTGQKLSEYMTLDQAKNLLVLDYIDLEVTEDATDEEKAFVKSYRIRQDITIDEIAEIVAGNKDNTDLKQKINAASISGKAEGKSLLKSKKSK